MGLRFVKSLLVLALLIGASFVEECFATTYYVGPSGSDSNDGLAYGNPFGTFGKAIGLANSGDTIYALGGTFNMSGTLEISKSGSTNNPINLWAYPGESPILDFSVQSESDGNRGIKMNSSADWWYIKGLTIQYAGDNGLYTEGDYGKFEQIVTRYNHDSGFQLHGTASNNLILNSDSYLNFDEDNGGENADGFAVKHENIGPGNIFRGNRAWANSDDGWDTYYALSNGVFIDNSWSFDNGFDIWPGGVTFQGDGTGYKLGEPGGDHVLTNVLAIDNAGHGIDINQNGTGVEVYNSTSYSNGKANWYFDEDSFETQNQHILQNNISLSGNNSDRFDSGVDHSYNTWNGSSFSVSNADFISVDRMDGLTDLLKQPRQPDGSLPDLGGFLHLIEGSNLIDAGTPISFTFGGVTYNLPYNDSALDLGAYETTAAVPILAGDYNDDGKVSAADYTVWRDNLGANITLENEDASPGVVDEEDYDVWLDHYGETNLGSGAGSGASFAAVPEPASVALAFLSLIIGLLTSRCGVLHSRGRSSNR